MTATAAVTEGRCAPFALQEVELGDLRDDEILVEVAASGICHTDLICAISGCPCRFLPCWVTKAQALWPRSAALSRRSHRATRSE